MKHIYFLFLLTLSSLIYAQPPAEGGLELNGTSEYIPVPNSNNINTTTVNTRTIETYFKVDNGTARQVIYEEGAQVNAFVLFVESGFVHAGFHKSNGANSIYFREPISDNTWYHVALVLDQPNGNALFYIDGTLMDTRSGAFAVPNHSGNVNIGRSDGNLRYPNCLTWTAGGTSEYCIDSMSDEISSNYYFGGHVWNFRVWDTVRTATEINDNKDAELATATPMLINLDFPGYDSATYLDSGDNFVSTSAILPVAEVDYNKQVKVFVNSGVLNIEVNNLSTPTSVQLFSVIGKQVVNTKYTEQINIASIAKGVYIIVLNFENSERVTKKIIL